MSDRKHSKGCTCIQFIWFVTLAVVELLYRTFPGKEAHSLKIPEAQTLNSTAEFSLVAEQAINESSLSNHHRYGADP